MFTRVSIPRISSVRPVGSFQKINVIRPGILHTSIQTVNGRPTTLKIIANTTISRSFADQKKDASKDSKQQGKEQPKDNKSKQEAPAKDNKAKQEAPAKDNKATKQAESSKDAKKQTTTNS